MSEQEKIKKAINQAKHFSLDCCVQIIEQLQAKNAELEERSSTLAHGLEALRKVNNENCKIRDDKIAELERVIVEKDKIFHKLKYFANRQVEKLRDIDVIAEKALALTPEAIRKKQEAWNLLFKNSLEQRKGHNMIASIEGENKKCPCPFCASVTALEQLGEV
jgi:flagellar biosynthesis/type III secretory pathway chaperone